MNGVTRIGFGCYRIAATRPHRDAVRLALGAGCTLFDTASTYSGGQSEQVLGEIFAQWEGRRPFVISKAGYVGAEDASLLSDRAGESAIEEMVVTAEGRRHCIHPRFVAAMLERSAARLGRAPDAYLLHNPEYYFQQASDGHSEDELYRRIGLAFELLENEVRRGNLRCYGVSSNHLSVAPAPGSISLERLLAVASRVSESHHFRIVQFPFNFFEMAAAKAGPGSKSLLEAASDSNVATIGNRPLNALTSAGPRRIATYERMVDGYCADRVAADIGRLRDYVVRALVSQLSDAELRQVAAVQFLEEIWRDAKDLEFVEYIFLHHIDPLGTALFVGRRRDRFKVLRDRGRTAALTHVLHRLSEEGLALREEFVRRNWLARDDGLPLPVAACRAYLSLGIDHLLVGMRNRLYVEDFRHLLECSDEDGSRAAGILETT